MKIPISKRKDMQDLRWKQRYENFSAALDQLSLAIELLNQRPLSNLENQGLIQGFEFTHELAWNVLKDYLEYEGITGLVGSRSTIREAFSRGLVDHGEVWMDMIEKRNLSSHTYNLTIAQQVTQAIIDNYYQAFIDLKQRLSQEHS
jgi:nucleotidyltransferase substrate binding protein (TIGR01987 family)